MNTVYTKAIPLRVTPEEHTAIKLAAFKAGQTIQKHVRLKLGLDRPIKETK